MKKITIVFLLLITAAVAGFSVTEEIVVYAYLYESALTHTAQLDILQRMAQDRLVGAGEFYAQALRNLVAGYSNIRNVTERNAADEQAMILAALLGAEKYLPAASDLWQVVERFQSPLVKAEALMSLGRIQARNFLPQVIRVLHTLNAAEVADRLSGERIAFGAIISLEKYQEPAGYLPVFIASSSEAWYSRRIRDQAQSSLPLIAEDPTPFMLEVVQGPGYKFETKLIALQTIEGANVSNANKVSIAVAALTEGWRLQSRDPDEIRHLVDMRKLAISMINRYRTDNESIYPELARSFTQGHDTNEKISAISALASQRTDQAALVLSGFLANLNQMNRDGDTSNEDYRMTRAIIEALGQAGRPIGRPALNEVRGSNWPPAVDRLADNALSQIGN